MEAVERTSSRSPAGRNLALHYIFFSYSRRTPFIFCYSATVLCLRSKNRLAFTLLELLVVLGILGILAAIVLVAINPRRQLAKSQVAEAIAESRELRRAIESDIVERGTSGLTVTYIIPVGANAAREVCKFGQTGSGCLSLDALVTSNHITSIPSHSVVPAANPGTGYRVFMNGAFVGTSYASPVTQIFATAN